MPGDSSDTETTRRDYVKVGGAILGSSVLAGCVSDSDARSTPTDTTTADNPSATNTTSKDQGFSVTMSPVGSVEFDGPPERMIAYDRQWLHMAYELGYGDAVTGFDDPGGTWFTLHETLPGVDFETDHIQSFVGEQVDKELIYELDPDLIAMDPYRAPRLEGLDDDDVDELRENVAPFFANRYSVTRSYPGNKTYTYYSLYDLYEKFGEAFQQQERVAALREIDRELTETIQSQLPPQNERPTVMKAGYYDGSFYTYDITQGGYGTRHYRRVGAKSAIRETYGDDVPFSLGSAVDMETLIEVDPDVLIEGSSLFYREIDGYSHGGIVESVRDEAGASEVTAISEGAHYPGGTPYVGPVAYLFYTELLAKYLYPETFGEYHGIGEIPEDEQLFDRQRVADIINGEI